MGDAGMLEVAEDFCLKLKAAQHLARAQPWGDDLQGDSSAGVFLARLVDDAHAAFADFLNDLVSADAPGEFVGLRGGRRIDPEGRRFQEALGSIGIAAKEGLDEGTELLIAGALRR